MSSVAITLRMTGYQLLSLSRNKRAMIFTVLFPIVLLVLFSSIFATGSGTETEFQGIKVKTTAYFTAGIIAYAITMASFSSLAIGLTADREAGLLKRYRGTPMPAWTFIAAQVLRSIVMVAAMVIVLLVIGNVFYDVPVPGDTLPGLIIYVLLGTATMCTLGVALTAITTTADSAATIAPFSALILSFISGVFIPVEQLPSWAESIGRIFPLSHLAEGLQATLVTQSTGTGLSGDNIAVLAVWCIGGLIVAARGFHWEPRSVRG